LTRTRQVGVTQPLAVRTLLEFVQHLLDKFGIEESVGFEWAHTCSKPCLDAYGGGAAIITATEIRS